ncbi:hypothetical protein MED01_007049 [Micromonospora sp. MED01]|uniref:hypothetical protein n=1 Tax=Micromonospora alfalfae TaxID=2911212 RepID=UPI001EE7B0B4|nr:hypothetical protein [Micromonospora alfalfae]MCG5462171.1 hypothetical protein [Micromonospora alfalfae]
MSDPTGDDGMRDFTRQLFTEHEDDNWPTAGATPAEPAQPKPSNYVPREGSTPSSSGGDWETRQWVDHLFTHSGVLG